jgi:DNA polymerase-3 subunit delta'
MNTVTRNCLFFLDDEFSELINLYKKGILPNKILLSGAKGSGKSTLGYHFINYALSCDEDYSYDLKKKVINFLNSSFNLIKNNVHPNFFLIDLISGKKNIEIEQIRKMINYKNKSSFNNKPKFILIDNSEYLSLSSSNALLKSLEEANEKVFYILIHNNNKKILPTIKSRFLNFKINLSFKKSLKITNCLLNDDLLNYINKDLLNYYSTPGDYINMIDFFSEKQIKLKDFTLIELLIYLIDNSLYRKNQFVKNLIINLIELYFLKIYRFSSMKQNILINYNSFIQKVNDVNTFNLDEESLFMEFKSKLLNE